MRVATRQVLAINQEESLAMRRAIGILSLPCLAKGRGMLRREELENQPEEVIEKAARLVRAALSQYYVCPRPSGARESDPRPVDGAQEAGAEGPVG